MPEERNLHTRALAGANARWQRDKKPVEERFWAKVQKTETCWLWTAFRNKAGYGVFGLEHHVHGQQGKNILAPRQAWILTYGPIPEGQYILHNCDNPSCVRPDHLRLGTLSENTRDMYAKGRGGDRRSLGEDNGNHVLTDRQVDLIRQLYPRLSQEKLADLTGASVSQVRNIIKGRQRSG